MKALIIMSLLCLMTACGGGGDSGSTSPADTAPESASDDTAGPDAESDSALEASVLTMDELVVPDGFRFSTLETMVLTVDLAEFSGERSFISLYSEYNDSTLKPVYRSKIMTAELSDGKAMVSFTLNNNQLPVIAEVHGLSSRRVSQKLMYFSSDSEVWRE